MGKRKEKRLVPVRKYVPISQHERVAVLGEANTVGVYHV